MQEHTEDHDIPLIRCVGLRAQGLTLLKISDGIGDARGIADCNAV